ncbi:glutamate--cysteine ligase, partial [Methylobacterium hispanicum]
MARDISDTTPLTTRAELIAWFAEGEKPREQFRIGTEHEKIPFYRADNTPVPYGGEHGIRALLEGLRRETGWEPILDLGNIIGLHAEAGGAISIEPGGQFELSGAALPDVHAT